MVKTRSRGPLLINPRHNVRRPFLELTLKVNGIKVAIAIGLSGLLIAAQRFDQRLVIAIGRWRNWR
jgi:hypothetical protein